MQFIIYLIVYEIYNTKQCLGNHEFDKKIEGLVPFIKNANYPILAANLNTVNEPELHNLKIIQKSVVLKVNGVSVGIIGFLTTTTKDITPPSNLEYLDEIEVVKYVAYNLLLFYVHNKMYYYESLNSTEAKKLLALGVKIIIGLSHSGYDRDLEIAKSCPDLDLIVGGHSNTFLYNGQAPSIEIPRDEYPTVITQTSGKKVLVVQAYSFTKYMGNLTVQVN